MLQGIQMQRLWVLCPYQPKSGSTVFWNHPMSTRMQGSILRSVPTSDLLTFFTQQPKQLIPWCNLTFLLESMWRSSCEEAGGSLGIYQLLLFEQTCLTEVLNLECRCLSYNIWLRRSSFTFPFNYISIPKTPFLLCSCIVLEFISSFLFTLLDHFWQVLNLCTWSVFGLFLWW